MEPTSLITPELLTNISETIRGVAPALIGRKKQKRVFKEQKQNPKLDNSLLPIPSDLTEAPKPKKKTNYFKYIFFGTATIAVGYGAYWLYSKYKNSNKVSIDSKKNPEEKKSSIIDNFIESLTSKNSIDEKSKEVEKEKDTVINLNINNLNGEKQSVDSRENTNRDERDIKKINNQPKVGKTRFIESKDDDTDEDNDFFDFESDDEEEG